jgi:hypothetical protein
MFKRIKHGERVAISHAYHSTDDRFTKEQVRRGERDEHSQKD